MAISDGQKVQAATDNAAFCSRTIDTDTVGIFDLKNPSSPFVLDVQQAINDLLAQTYAEETLSAGGTISSDNDQRHQIRRLKSSGGEAVLSSTPFGTSGLWRDGTVIELVGTDNANYCTIPFNDLPYGAIVNGDIELEKYRTLVLRWDSVLIRWIEIGRNK